MKKALVVLLVLNLLFLVLIGFVLFPGIYRFLSLSEEKQVANSILPYPGAVYKTTFTTSWPDSYPSFGIIYEVDAEPQEILTFYKERMPAEGWKLKSESGPGD